jgi:formate-dependent phosphoribosylglycinamide formyltransferase (GAR transformylase)
VCGKVPSDPCHTFADESLDIDYSDRKQLLELVRKKKYQYIVPSCNDYAYLSGAWVAEQEGLPGFDNYDTTLILHNKNEFRKFADKNGYPIPKASSIHELDELEKMHLPKPILVKPVDSYSGRGMTKVHNTDELKSAIASAISSSRTREALVEDFIEGTLHSHSVLFQNGRVVFEIVADEFCTVYPYQVNCSNIPSSLPHSLREKVSDCIQEMVTQLQLTDGLLHTQFMVRDNEFWLIECMRRSPGDLYHKMVELSTGVNCVDLYARPFVGFKMPEVVHQKINRPIARHTISVASSTLVTSFSINLPAFNLQTVSLKNSGEIVNKAPYDKLGIFFAEFKSETEMFKTTPNLANHVLLQTPKDIHCEQE